MLGVNGHVWSNADGHNSDGDHDGDSESDGDGDGIKST